MQRKFAQSAGGIEVGVTGPGDGMSLSARRILVVEDSDAEFATLSAMLADINSGTMCVERVTAEDAARQALSLAQHDVCLLDDCLGGRSSLDLLRSFANQKAVPIILLTAVEDHRVDVEAACLGASDYLVKGHINAALLERSIRYAMQRKASELALLEIRDAMEERVRERTMELAASNAALQEEMRVREVAEADTRIRARQQEAVAELGRIGLTDIDLQTLSLIHI